MVIYKNTIVYILSLHPVIPFGGIYVKNEKCPHLSLKLKCEFCLKNQFIGKGYAFDKLVAFSFFFFSLKEGKKPLLPQLHVLFSLLTFSQVWSITCLQFSLYQNKSKMLVKPQCLTVLWPNHPGQVPVGGLTRFIMLLPNSPFLGAA